MRRLWRGCGAVVALVLVLSALPGPSPLPVARAYPLGPGTTYPAGKAPFGIAAGDLDGNGRLGLAVANSGDNTVSVLRGNGDGTFQAKKDIPVGTGPSSVALAKLNNDNRLDLVVTNAFSNNVSVLLADATGNFANAPGSPIAVGLGPVYVGAADLNGDNKLDLVVANALSASVSVLLGNGDGTFQPKQDVTVGGGPFSIAVADLNGDGKVDLVTANSADHNLSVLLGNGAGTFAPAPGSPVAAGAFPQFVVAGEFTGNATLDLLVANGSDNNIQIMAGTGTGTFTPQAPVAVGLGTTSLAVADFNQDGRSDVAVSLFGETANNVAVLTGKPGGGFNAPDKLTAGSAAYAVAAGDFNGDGSSDLAVANFGSANLSVFLNAAGAAPAPAPVAITTLTSAPNPSQPGQLVTFTAKVSGPGGAVPNVLGMVNFRDGSTDLGTVAYDATGQATVATSALTPGSHTITATFIGNANTPASTSAPLTHVVGQPMPTATATLPATATASVTPTPTATTVTVTAGAPGSNLVPNPSFEDIACGGAPCHWTANTPGLTLATDTSANTGSRSLRLTLSQVSAQAVTSCITGVTPGDYQLALAFRTTDLNLGNIGPFIEFYTDAACTTLNGSPTGTGFTVNRDGLWHWDRFQATVPPGTQSIRVGLTVSAATTGGNAPASPVTVLVDDVYVSTAPPATATPVVIPAGTLGANLAPNPGFEDVACNGLPCNWSAASGGAGLASGTTAHGGSRSLRTTATYSYASVLSTCITGVPAGSYQASIWYRTTDPNVTELGFGVLSYAGPGCPDPASPDIVHTPAQNDGQWHQLSGTAAVPADRSSLRLSIALACQTNDKGACTAPVSVDFDDVVLSLAEPTATVTATATATAATTAASTPTVTASPTVAPGAAPGTDPALRAERRSLAPLVMRAANGWDSGIQVQNTGSGPATVYVSFYQGATLVWSEPGAVIAAGAAKTYFLPALTGLPNGFAGSAVIGATAPVAAIVNLTNYNLDGSGRSATSAYNAVDLTRAWSQAWLPGLRWGSTVQVQNAGDAAAPIRIDFLDAAGQSFAFTERVLAPAESAAFTAPPAAVSAHVAASGPNPPNLAVINWGVSPSPQGVSMVASFPAFSPPSNCGYQVAPLVMRRPTGWSTELAIQNTSDTAYDVYVQYYDTAGTPLDAAGEHTTLAPGASFLSRQADNAGLPADFVGTAFVWANTGQNLAVAVAQTNPALNQTTGYRGVAQDLETATTLYAPLLMKAHNGWNTGLQVQNMAPEPASVTVTYFDTNNQQVATQHATLAATSPATFYTPDVPGLPADFVGSAVITSNHPRGLTGLVNQNNYQIGNGGDNAMTYTLVGP